MVLHTALMLDYISNIKTISSTNICFGSLKPAYFSSMGKMGNYQFVKYFCAYLQSEYRSQGFSQFVTNQIKNKTNIHYLN
jgi:hypothetical protein